MPSHYSPYNRPSGYQQYRQTLQNQRSAWSPLATARQEQMMSPEGFDRSWAGVGGNRAYFATPEMRQSWQNQISRYGGAGSSVARWQNGQYGVWRGTLRGFEPFDQQPGRSPEFITNPAGYQRNQLMSEYQTAMDEARRNTEERYQEALANLEGVGEQQSRDIDTRFDSSRSAVNQSLVDSGLSSTTVLPSMRRGVERERTDAQARLAAMLARERNQVIQSRNDIPPNLEMLTNLMFRQGVGGGR